MHIKFKSENHNDRPLGRPGVVGSGVYFLMGLTRLGFEEED